MSRYRLFKTLIYTFTFVILSFLTIGCDTQDPNHTEEDNDNTPVVSCTKDQIIKISIETLNWDEQTQICKIIAEKLMPNPPVSLLRNIFKLISLAESRQSNLNLYTATMDIINIIYARNQKGDMKAINNSLNTLWKIILATEGQVNLHDMSVNLRQAGIAASGLSDEGIITVATMIWEQKKASLDQ